MESPCETEPQKQARTARLWAILLGVYSRLLWHPRTPRLRRLFARIHYLIFKLDTAGVELLCAQLSFFVAFRLLQQGVNVGPTPYHLFGIFAFLGATFKFTGCLLEWRYLRYLGLGCGIFFWLTLGVTVVGNNSGSVMWVALVCIGLAQLWALLRITAEG